MGKIEIVLVPLGISKKGGEEQQQITTNRKEVIKYEYSNGSGVFTNLYLSDTEAEERGILLDNFSRVARKVREGSFKKNDVGELFDNISFLDCAIIVIKKEDPKEGMKKEAYYYEQREGGEKIIKEIEEITIRRKNSKEAYLSLEFKDKERSRKFFFSPTSAVAPVIERTLKMIAENMKLTPFKRKKDQIGIDVAIENSFNRDGGEAVITFNSS